MGKLLIMLLVASGYATEQDARDYENENHYEEISPAFSYITEEYCAQLGRAIILEFDYLVEAPDGEISYLKPRCLSRQELYKYKQNQYDFFLKGE